jgi:hypothetical protein
VWNYLQIERIHGQDVQVIIYAAKVSFNNPLFMELVILACWNIWKQWNGKKIKARGPLSLAGRETSFMMYPCLSIG